VSTEIIVPEIVAAEINVRGKNDPTAQAIANTAWLAVNQTLPVSPQIQAWGLGPGESAVLAGRKPMLVPKQLSKTSRVGDVLRH
jgi:hypothetical protein